jgi:tetratricopeptide (TPR) repeat protein
MMGSAIRVEALGVDRYAWKEEELERYEQFFLKYTRKVPLPMGGGYSLYEIAPREGFSYIPEYLPGTEKYYIENIAQLMGLKQASDIVGKPIRQDVYTGAYDAVAKQHPELGYACFQSAIALLSTDPSLAPKALEAGKAGFVRNGDQASWSALQADVWLVKNKPAKAKPLLLEAQRLSPERDDVARNLAVAYYNEHDLDKAVEEAQLALNLAPSVEDYQKLLKQLLDLRAAAH